MALQPSTPPKETEMPVARRRAETEWHGSAAEGSGTLNLRTSGAGGPLPVSLASRVQEADRSQTNPEELIAGAHSTCFAMAFANVLSSQGNPPETLDVKARVTLDRVGEGFGITESELTITGVVPGLDQAAFEAAAELAEQGCPVSNALRGNVDVVLKVTLAS
jgi:osmotically inducible protein OsmC